MVFVGRVNDHNRVSLEKMCIYFGVLMHLHFLHHISVALELKAQETYHLEGVELLFDLLSQHRC